ncbi:MAG: hypothetical protein AAF333_11310 [Planctomycetota bacterium]
MSDTFDPNSPEPDVTLTPEDAAAFDALMAARGLGAEAGPMPPGTAERAGAVRALMNVLDTDAVPPDAGADGPLVRATLVRIAAARAAEAQPVLITALSEADGEAVDAVLAADGGAGPVPSGLGGRAEKIRGLLSVLELARAEDETEAAGNDDAVRRTVEAVAELRRKEQFAQQVEMFSQPRRTLGVGWRQVLSAAAVFLIGISLLMPAIDGQRQQAQQAACSFNLGMAGQQMGAYTADHAGMLPRGPVGEAWNKTGTAEVVDDAGRYQSNSAHLYLLVRHAYVAPERLACASNQDASVPAIGTSQIDWDSPKAISYSYQNQHGSAPIRVDRSRPQLAVLADKSPLFIAERGRLIFNDDAERDARTTLHRGKGQNVLALDGSVRWTVTPVVADDNIWQITGHAGSYRGTETPADAQRDSFLVP